MLTGMRVYTQPELRARYEILMENYCKTVTIEANTMTDMARGMILPAIEAYAGDVASAGAAKRALLPDARCGYETRLVERLTGLTAAIELRTGELENALIALHEAGDATAEAGGIRDSILPKMAELRAVCDEAETVTAKGYWPLPSYSELLFGVK